jgi:glutamine amidotransferase
MANLEQYGLLDPIRKGIASGKPFLGICLGLQLLFTESEDFGVHKGLDIVPGKVRRFPFKQGSGTRTSPESSSLKVPHMGWNELALERVAPPIQNVPTGTHVYFVHSYYVEPSDPTVIATTTDYGRSFVSSIWRENIFACQFHPEKSQTVGLQIVKNFAEWRLS